ncbi:hypothetical protein P8452_64278 [Trifolium repens]|nr:hypothetical protein P8452_64278 [Trifolium repens]
MTIGNMSDCPDRVHKRLPKLVRANISNTPIIHLPLEPFCIVESLRLVEVFDNIPVFSNLTHVQLVYYTYVDWHLCFDVLKKCPKLQNFDLDTPTSIFNHILGPFYNVQSLRFQFHQGYYHDNLVPTFHNLTQLKLNCYDYSWQFLLDVLNHCPKLQMLDLDEVEVDGEVQDKKEDKENWRLVQLDNI